MYGLTTRPQLTTARLPASCGQPSRCRSTPLTAADRTDIRLRCRDSSCAVSRCLSDIGVSQYLSNAPTRSSAISFAVRPSIWCRSSMNTSLPSLSSADLRRRRRIAGEVASRALRLPSTSCPAKTVVSRVRLHRVLKCACDGGSRVARGASANGIHDDERRSLRILQLCVDLIRCPHLFNAELRELLPHRRNNSLVVHRYPRLLSDLASFE